MMRKKGMFLTGLLAFCLLLSLMIGTTVLADYTDNVYITKSSRYRMFPLANGGYDCVICSYNANSTTPIITVERLNASSQRVFRKSISLNSVRPNSSTPDAEIIWGGAFEGAKYNFLVTGQINEENSSTVTAIRVSKFSKDWAYLDACSVYEENHPEGQSDMDIYYPMDQDYCCMEELDGNLWVVTSREESSGHTGRIALIVDESTMKLKANAGDFFHSFDSDLVVSNGRIFCLELSEGNRRAYVEELGEKAFIGGFSSSWLAGSINYRRVFDYWYSAQYVSRAYPLNGWTGGLAASDSKKKLLAVGNALDTAKVEAANGSMDGLTSNIWLRVLSQDGLKIEKSVYLTSLADGGIYAAKDARIVRIDDNRFLILWRLLNISTQKSTMQFVYVDANGNKISDVWDADNAITNGCDPVCDSRGNACWCTENTDSTLKIHTIATADFTGNSHKVYLTFDANGGTLDASYSGEMTCAYPSSQKWELPVPSAPAGTTYEFDGWYTEASGGEKVDGTARPFYRKNLYAHWSVPLDSSAFPDSAFLNYVKGLDLDDNNDGRLSLDEVKYVRSISCQEMGIKSLKGIENFCEVTSLYCNGNDLSAVNADGIRDLQYGSTYCEHTVTPASDFTFDLSTLTDMDVSRIIPEQGGTIEGNTLTFTKDSFTYKYAITDYATGSFVLKSSVAVTDAPSPAQADAPSSSSPAGSGSNLPDSSSSQTGAPSNSNPAGSGSNLSGSSPLQAGADAEKITIPRKVKGIKAKVKKNKVKLSWKKIKKTKKTKAILAMIQSVQIQYATDPGFTKNVASKMVGKKKTKVTLKLQGKTTYYVRIRYVSSDGVSLWSKVKKVKVK